MKMGMGKHPVSQLLVLKLETGFGIQKSAILWSRKFETTRGQWKISCVVHMDCKALLSRVDLLVFLKLENGRLLWV